MGSPYSGPARTKPRLTYLSTRLNGKWRCSGPTRLDETGQWYCTFPWGYGATPLEAYTAWKKLQKRPTPPTIDEHAANPGAL